MKERVVWQYIEQLLLLSWWFQWKTLCYIFFTHQFFMKELCFYFDRCSNQANKNVGEPKDSSTVSKDKIGIAKTGEGWVVVDEFLFKTMKDTFKPVIFFRKTCLFFNEWLGYQIGTGIFLKDFLCEVFTQIFKKVLQKS